MNLWDKCRDGGMPIIKRSILGVLIGIIGGLLGTVFHTSVDLVTELREHIPYLILFLPVGGLVIAAMYNAFRAKGNIDTKRVFQSVKGNNDVPIVMIPLIFIGTVITHMLGGSAGREGAALQLGGSMGYNLGKALKQEEDNTKIMVTAGMSSIFSALFGTPLTATIFSLEVTGVYKLRYLFSGLISSVTAFAVAQMMRVAPVRLAMPTEFGYQTDIILKVVVLGALCAVVCRFFSIALHKSEGFVKKFISNTYIRAAVGGLLIVLLTAILKTTDYNGAGMNIIMNAVSGDVKNGAFLMKIIFTVITVAAGFKGGEIVPTFFIGATFGCFAGGLMGINPGLGACLGFVALFSGMTKCPVASFLLAIEVFGVTGMPLFAIAVIVTYLLSGQLGLYGNAENFAKFHVCKTK